MNLWQAEEGTEYIVSRIECKDAEMESFLFSLGCFGGAPITDEFCKQIGADVYTPDAASAADKAAEYCKEM